MAGETIKTEALCLDIRPWSKTSHIVKWLTPNGKVGTIVKGAVRPKSFFLGQYDLNYTCEILYYARARGDLHALRECTPVERRDGLRGDYRRLLLAEHVRQVTGELASAGPEARGWYDLAVSALDGAVQSDNLLGDMLEFEISALRLAGVSPDFTGCRAPFSPFYLEEGSFKGQSSRQMPISPMVAACLMRPKAVKNPTILLDAARVIGVYYNFHLDFSLETRRTIVKLVAQGQGDKT